MAKVVVVNHVTFDGVMQVPGRPDEDTPGEFAYGDWAIRGNDEVMGRKRAGGMAKSGSPAARPPDLRGLVRILAQPDRQPVHRGPQPRAQVRDVTDAQGAAVVVHLDPARW
jgi:hypothetical protein